jgi:hypothetical protein
MSQDHTFKPGTLEGLADAVLAGYAGDPIGGGGSGSKGDKGDPGKDGADGKDGKDGLPGADGKDGADAGDSPHDHDDYLPLAGGTVTGDLTVDGTAKLSINEPSNYRYLGMSGVVFIEGYGCFGRMLAGTTSIASNGYPNAQGNWTSFGVQDANGSLYGATQIDLAPTGRFDVRVETSFPTGSSTRPDSQFMVTEAGPTFRAMPSTRTVDDVLGRAETAAFPPEDDEGVAMMDGHDEVPLFEVMSALLAKVKQQSEQIAELSERIATVEA